MDNSLRILSGAVTDRGLSEKRPQNEDSYLEMGRCGIYAVADGVGGAQAGEVASQMAVEILGEAFANINEGADAETVMRTAIERANAAIYQMAQELPQLSNMATTVVALHLAGNIATIGHVGDSRLYRVDRDGILYRETADHSMVAEEVRAGRMTEEQAENHPSRNIISRALGAEATIKIDLKTMMVEPGNAFLICSDGITRHIADQEIKGVLTFGGDPLEICDYLKNLCYERGAEDNLTAVVVKVSAPIGERPIVPQMHLFDSEESTVATARTTFENPSPVADDDELLELETHDLTMPHEELEIPREINSNANTVPIDENILFDAGEETIHIFDQNPIENSKIAAGKPALTAPLLTNSVQPDSFSMFGNSGISHDEDNKSSPLGKIASAIGFVLLGSVIGLWVYHFALLPKPSDTEVPRLSEMKAANIPLSAFEENRRNVDKDPAGYITKFGADPQDSEDFYLLGRAYLLTADYPRAQTAFNGARLRLPDADPVNAKILTNDIAMALAVTNDTTIQSILKKELDATIRPSADTNTNTNANR
ncbi:MAG: protein phosphatase 2C domain-containing protein [Pyrinomonadaceae bacterium]